MTSDIPARPTIYKGIQMRSRLEADYAAACDRRGEAWEYEPACFAGPDGQWLPDFRVGTHGVYVEVKSAHLLEPEPADAGLLDVYGRVDVILKKMTVAWLSEPDALLELAFCVYGRPEALIIGGQQGIPWLGYTPATSTVPLLWPGLGQWADLRRGRSVVAQSEDPPAKQKPKAKSGARAAAPRRKRTERGAAS